MSERVDQMSDTLPVNHQINWKSIKASEEDDIIEYIFTYGSDCLYTVDDTGLYPIHWAVINGRLNLVKHMIDVGVSPRMKAGIPEEPEPIHLAADKGHIEIIDLLVDKGIDINASDRTITDQSTNTRFGLTPVQRSVLFTDYYEKMETVLHLIKRGADINRTDESGSNCLHIATVSGNQYAVRLLLEIGFNANLVTNSGLRPYDIAVNKKDNNLIRILATVTDDINELHRDYMALMFDNQNKSEPNINQMSAQTSGKQLVKRKKKIYYCTKQGCSRTDGFPKKSNYLRHLDEVHKDLRPEKCDWPGCTKSFKRSDHLNEHKKTHKESKTRVNRNN